MKGNLKMSEELKLATETTSPSELEELSKSEDDNVLMAVAGNCEMNERTFYKLYNKCDLLLSDAVVNTLFKSEMTEVRDEIASNSSDYELLERIFEEFSYDQCQRKVEMSAFAPDRIVRFWLIGFRQG